MSAVDDRRRPVRIGVTGPIGCGKSTVARWLAQEPGVISIDADELARTALSPGTAAVRAVADRFGADLVDTDGVVDRAALARIVFSDPDALRDLEAIVHPVVRTAILARLDDAERAGATAVVIEAIKLVEGGLAESCDEVWLVTCDRDTQRRRLLGRGDDPADAARRIDAQGDLASRLTGRADRTIATDGEVATTRTAVQAALSAALSRRA